MTAAAGRLRDRLSLIRGIVATTAGPSAALKGIRTVAAGRRLAEPGEPVGVPMKALDGRELLIRPGTSDMVNAVANYRHASQMPAPAVSDPRQIVELGTNCGVALTALGVAFPRAQLLGVEADPVNVAAARRNTARFGDRCDIVEAAVWDATTELVLVPSDAHGSHGTTARAAEPTDDRGWVRMRGRTIDDLLDENLAAGVRVDYLHVSLEGTEQRVFAAAGDWPERVESLRVEVHPYFGYETGDCIAQLEELGYRAWEAPDPPAKWVFAVRR